ncbi:MAG: DUF6671 family protein, partial [Dokdonella sp.]
MSKRAVNFPSRDRYSGQTAALLTQHGKEQIIAPVFAKAFGCRIERVSGHDTDLLGTFTRDIPRAGTQIEAARKKARLGMQLGGRDLGLASEGAFGPDPMTGLFSWNVEFVLWIDEELDLEVVGRAQGAANFAHMLASEWTAAETFARQWKFPEHQLVLRPQHENDPRVRKGISCWAQFETDFAWALEQSPN